MIVYLQHGSEKPIRVEVKDPVKYAKYKEEGVVELNGKLYTILEGDVRESLIFWEEPKVKKAKETSWDEFRKRAEYFKKYKQWPK